MKQFFRMYAFPLTIAALAVAFLVLFFLVPVLKVFSASLYDAAGKTLTLSNYSHVLSNRFFLNALGNSLAIAAAAFALTIAIGVPFAFCIARLPIGGKAALLALAALPLVLPSFVSAYALVLMFGRGGIVTGAMRSIGIPFESIYGMKGIIMTYTLTLYPYVVLPTVAALRSVDVSIEEAAQNLGSSRLRMLRTVTLPIVMPSILAGGLLVFIEAMENFGVPFRFGRRQANSCGGNFQAVCRRNRSQPVVGGRAGHAADFLHDCRAVDPAQRVGAALLRDRGEARAAFARGEPPVARRRRSFLLDGHRRCSGAVCRRHRHIVHAI